MQRLSLLTVDAKDPRIGQIRSGSRLRLMCKSIVSPLMIIGYVEIACAAGHDAQATSGLSQLIVQVITAILESRQGGTSLSAAKGVVRREPRPSSLRACHPTLAPLN